MYKQYLPNERLHLAHSLQCRYRFAGCIELVRRKGFRDPTHVGHRQDLGAAGETEPLSLPVGCLDPCSGSRRSRCRTTGQRDNWVFDTDQDLQSGKISKYAQVAISTNKKISGLSCDLTGKHQSWVNCETQLIAF